MEQIQPSYAGGAAFGPHDLAGHYELRADASRFNLPGSPFVPALAGMRASLRWFLDDVGADWAYKRIGDNAARCRELLEAIEGVGEALTPPGRHAGLVHFTVAGWQPAAVEEELRAREVLIRSMQEPACVRASTGFYNSGDDLRALAEGVKDLLRQQAIPPASAAV